jgi:hypothetical protein
MIFDGLDYPITGPGKPLMLILEWVIAFLFFEAGLIFIVREKRAKRNLKEFQERAVIAIGFGYSAMWIFKIIGDFYMTDVDLRNFFRNYSVYSLTAGAILFIYLMDKYRFIPIKKYLLTLSFLSLYIIYVILTSISEAYTSILLLLFFGPYLLYFFIFYLKKLRSIYIRKKKLRKYAISSSLFLIGVILLFAGYVLSTDYIRITFNLSLLTRFIGDLHQLIAVIILMIFFLYIPSISEYDWRENVNGILIMNKTGLKVYSKFYKEEVDEVQEILISGLLTSMKLMLENTTQRKGISIIEQKGQVFIIYPGKYVYGVLICEKSLMVPQILLKSFIERIEKIYFKVLEAWTGETEIFKPIEYIFREVFE